MRSIFKSAGLTESVLYNDDEQIGVEQPSKMRDLPDNVNLERDVSLSLRLKRKIVQSSSFKDQTFPLLVSLAVGDLKSSYRAPIDLVCVIDHSASMEGEKIELLKNTFNYLLKYLSDSDRLSIVIFDDDASRLFPLIRTTESNKKKILLAVQEIEEDGGTDINLGMMHALKILKERRYANPVSSIFLLSDGLDEEAQSKVQESLHKFGISNDITINTFGFGNDHDPELMSGIAYLRDGNFYFIEKLDTIDEAFIDCLGGLLTSVAQSVQIKIKPEQSEVLQGVEIVKAYGEPSMWSFENGYYMTRISNLISGTQKDFIVDLKVPINKKELQDHQKSIKIASAEAKIIGLDGQTIKKYTDLRITLLNETEEVEQEEEEEDGDKEVMKNFFRIKGASLMNEARKLADQGKNEQSKKLLDHFKEELENSFLKEEQFIKNLIQDIKIAKQVLEPALYEHSGRKNIINSVRSQTYQKSNLSSANNYQNNKQTEMLNQVRGMKNLY